MKRIRSSSNRKWGFMKRSRFVAAVQRKLAKNVDVSERFAYYYKKCGAPWDTSDLFADLEEGGVNPSVIADMKARVEQIDLQSVSSSK